MSEKTIQVSMYITELAQLSAVTDCLQRQLQRWSVPLERQMDLRLCIMEAAQNGLLYGCTGCGRDGVQIRWRCDSRGFSFTVADNGPGVPLELRQCHDVSRSLEEHGRGLYLMEALLDEMSFSSQGNCITGRLSW